LGLTDQEGGNAGIAAGTEADLADIFPVAGLYAFIADVVEQFRFDGAGREQCCADVRAPRR